MKHILALTYEPKIPDVQSGKCTQTIRPCSQRPRNKNDRIMFHGWEGKPYNSKWSFRTPYWEIMEVIPIHISWNQVIINPWLDSERMMTNEEMQDIAQRDGFKNYGELYNEFVRMYKSRLEQMIFEIIRWKFTL